MTSQLLIIVIVLALLLLMGGALMLLAVGVFFFMRSGGSSDALPATVDTERVQERLRTLSLIADRVAAATARLAGATSQHCSQPAIPIPMTHFSVRTPDG